MPPENPTSSSEAVRPAEAPAIAITATFTAEALEPALAFWTRELGWDFAIRFAPYNQVFQQLLDPNGLLARNRNGINIALVRLEDWARFDHSQCLELLEENVRHFIDALQAAALPAPLLVALCPASPAFLADPGRAAFLARTEEHLASAIASLSTVFLLTPGEVEAVTPVPVQRPGRSVGEARDRVVRGGRGQEVGAAVAVALDRIGRVSRPILPLQYHLLLE
jgi:hypothetical protein